jgi:hypothetical protein
MNAPLKPHLKLKASPMANELDTPRTGGVPDFLRKMSTGTSFGNIDASDLKPPRLKVLAGQSPEVLDGVPNALPGNFWVTILNLNLGPSVIGSPILLRKSYQVWAPKTPGSSQSGPLATSSDGINWDVPNQSFEVKFYGNPRTYTWKIGKTVAETGSHKFGTQQDDDPKSKPIATLTYDILWLIDLPNGQKQLVVFTSSRTGTKPTQTFISTTKAMGIDQFYQRYRIVVQKKTGPTGDPYFSYAASTTSIRSPGSSPTWPTRRPTSTPLATPKGRGATMGRRRGARSTKKFRFDDPSPVRQNPPSR